MKRYIFFITFVLVAFSTFSQGYKVGDVATDFRLKNVDEKMVSLSDYPKAKGFIVIFTCNHCPYSQAYEDRIIAIHEKYESQGYPVVAINPNDPAIEPEDSFEEMQKRAKDKGFKFAYLFDDGQKVFPVYGATRTPHVFLLEKTSKGNVVRYIGAIDDNYEDPSAVEHHYLADAVDVLLLENGTPIDPEFTKAIGCSIKTSIKAKLSGQ